MLKTPSSSFLIFGVQFVHLYRCIYQHHHRRRNTVSSYVVPKFRVAEFAISQETAFEELVFLENV